MKKALLIFCFFSYLLGFAQQTEYVNFTKGIARIKIEPDSSKVSGLIAYDFDVKKTIDSIYIDAKKMMIDDVFLDNKPVDFKYNQSKIILNQSFETGKTHNVLISYSAEPKKALYFLKQNDGHQIWTQGQGKYTSNWLPSFDDVNEKVKFDLSVTFDENYTVLANGDLGSIQKSGSFKTWHYSMQKPMSSYLVALAIGKYSKKSEISKSGIPLVYYYYPEDSLKVEPTYRYTKRMFDFLEDEIGFAYPWQNYKQVPVHDFLYSGMENTSLTIFTDAFVVDSTGFNDKNYVNVNAHELAHQWFGNLVTATSGEHHWLQEGFATYYALLAEKDVFGQDYYDFKLYDSAQQLGRQDTAGSGTSLLNPKSSSLTFYQRGAWVLHALRKKVGDTIFKKSVKKYLEKYQFANVKTSDFIDEVELLYKKPLDEFVSVWIEAKTFPFDEAVELLRSKSTLIQEYIMVDCETTSSKCEDYLNYYISDKAKIKVIAQRPDLVNNKTFSESREVRQAISQYVTKIPVALQANYETLLDDKSYITIENALYNLWTSFPSARSRYLAKTKNIQGFNDKNIRLLWLVLNLNTQEYQTDKQEELLEELISYTTESANFRLRIKAFEYLYLIGVFDEKSRKNLKLATKHHNWRLVKFAKGMLEKIGD